MIDRTAHSGMEIQWLGKPEHPTLVLLHGWGFGAEVWRTLVNQLLPSFHLCLINLPGYGNVNSRQCIDWTLESLLTTFSDQIKKPAFWCGWSLGGMLATHYAYAHPERVKGILTVASNPIFVVKDDWPTAMSRERFGAFVDAVSKQPLSTLNRFAGLVTQGAASARADLRWLKPLLSKPPAPTQLIASLALLGMLDLREAITKIQVPQYHFFCENDALVPPATAEATQNLNAKANIKIIPGASHIPWLSNAQCILDTVREFYQPSAPSE